MTAVSRSAGLARGTTAPVSSEEAAGTPFALPSWLAWGGRAALPLILVLTSSCLVPQTVDPTSTSPHHPPRIVIDQIPLNELGPFVTLVRAPRDRCHCELTLSIPAVAEDDPAI